jgi:putative signal transducing protein
MFCPQCEAEYREGFTECSDCGVALVEALEPKQRDEVAPGLTAIMETSDAEELGAIVDRLEKAGVPYTIEAGTAMALLDGRDDEVPHPWQARLSVATEMLERAERIVQQARRSHRPYEGPLS